MILRFPPVFQTNYRTVKDSPAWTQTEKEWRLQLVARTTSALDDQNFLGVTTSADAAKRSRVYEPPIAPTKNAVSIAMAEKIDGKDALLAQSLSATGDRATFDVKVETRDAGPVTVTWPNLSTIPGPADR
ncbi:MAG: hypothetical protein C4320_04415 [Armatimonadota bacterium]